MAAIDQKPLGSGIDRNTPAAELLAGMDLSGQLAIVTGGYSGIGLETTRALAGAGATVLVPARSPERASEALAAVRGDVEIAHMDLGDLSTVRRFAEDVVSNNRPVHLLINNAGIMANPLTRVGPDWESQFATNHLGHMAMTTGILPVLRAAEGARVVCLSSTAHAICDVHWDDPHFHNHEYDKWQAYGQSKTANALFALGLDTREANAGIRAFSVHPGGIFTPLQRHLPEEEMVALGWKNADGSVPDAVQAMFKTPEAGASTTIFAATSTLLNGKGGLYCEDCDVSQLAGPDAPRYAFVRDYACDPERATRLWDMSADMLANA